MLPQAGKIHESQIHELDLLLLAKLQNVTRGHRRKPPSRGRGVVGTSSMLLYLVGTVKTRRRHAVSVRK
jgi:hypothetical protein